MAVGVDAGAPAGVSTVVHRNSPGSRNTFSPRLTGTDRDGCHDAEVGATDCARPNARRPVAKHAGKESSVDLKYKRILVTGGSGFLGGHVLTRLRQVGCRQIVAPRSAEYDLTREPDVIRLLQKERPEVVLHLAAKVGGIGA